jgi:1-acyl-sn-glycerol-3-phosphate acyltransferase
LETALKPNSLLQALAKTILRLTHWKLDIHYPSAPKYVLIGAPHTSNWDLWFALLLMYASGVKLTWIGKHTLFRWPIGGLLRWLGGIPVNRASRNNFVQQIVDAFNRFENLVIAIAPESTRSKVDYWKTGFYYIAMGAGVPIALGFIDYPNRVVGIGPTLIPSGDLQADFDQIKTFYANKQGVNPGKQGPIQLRPEP